MVTGRANREKSIGVSRLMAVMLAGVIAGVVAAGCGGGGDERPTGSTKGVLSGETEAAVGTDAGGDIAYTACSPDFEPGTCSIYLMDADGSGRRLLVDGDGRDAQLPRWSPDGTHLLYSLCEVTEEAEVRCEEYLTGADGDEHTLLGEGGTAVWSPDGSAIAFCEVSSSSSEPCELVVVAASGGSRKVLTVSSDPHTTWSPDGSRLALIDRVGTWDVYVINADGSGRVKITDDDAEDLFPVWSPNSERIAFVSCAEDENAPRGEFCNLYAINADGTERTRLTPEDSLQGAAWPHWSPDGSRVALSFCPLSDDPDLVSYIGYCDIHVVRADGSGTKAVTMAPYDDLGYLDLSWSPEGDRIVFSGQLEGEEVIPFDVFVVNADGTGLVNLTDDDDSADLYPAWRPGR